MNKPLCWGYQYFIIWFIVSYQKFILFSPLWYFIRYQTHVMCHGDIKMPVMTKNNKYVCVWGGVHVWLYMVYVAKCFMQV